MTEDYSSNLVSEEVRCAFTDMTNVPSKRDVSSNSRDLLRKSGEESDKSKTMSHEDSGLKFSNRLCSVVDDLLKKTSVQNSCDESENVETVVGKESRESLDTFVQPLVDYSDDDDEEMEIADEDCNELKKDCNPSEHQELPSCQNFRSFEMSKCSNVNAAGQEQNQNVRDDLLKSCSCSFCLKAAFILADIHYQDIKGRVHELKMSHKTASNAIQRNDAERPKDFPGATDPILSAKIGSQMNSQWRPLFLNMRDTIAREISHLEDSLETVIRLRENRKKEIEKRTKRPQNNTKW